MNKAICEPEQIDAFREDGFVMSSGPLVEPELLERVRARIPRIMAGEYETGVVPGYPGPTSEATVVKGEPKNLYALTQSHLADRTMWELVTHPAVGRWVASLYGADWVQLWGTTFFYKPSGVKEEGNIGWHQDNYYFQDIWQPDDEVFFCSLAISDIEANMGPVVMIRGSQKWGLLGWSDFYDQNMDATRDRIPRPEGTPWEEVNTTMPMGAISVHHKNTLHGSCPNQSGKQRLSIILQFRTRKSTPVSGSSNYYIQNLDNPEICPVVYER